MKHSPSEYQPLLAQLPAHSVYLGGRFVKTSRAHMVFGKADGQRIAEVGYADAATVGEAIAEAAQAFATWRKSAPAERSRWLHALAAALEARSAQFALLEAHHAGKTIADAELDVRMGVQALQWFASCALHLDGRVVQGTPSQHKYVRREPLGVCGLLLPWNFPLLLMLAKVGAALACGNTVVVKPASETPLTALAFALLCDQVGLPAGVFNVLPGSGAEVGLLLASHPGIAKVSFTGSNAVGQQVAAAAAKSTRPVTLELGGKSPAIVCADADLDRAAAGVASVFGHAGQKCAARTRCIVVDSMADALVERLVAKARALVVGDPLDRATTLGPVINAAAQDSILGYCRDAQEEGARLLCGGAAPSGVTGPFVEATLFDHASNRMRFAREEIFGPVLAVIRVRDLDEAIAVANDSDYGLAATVWTKSLATAHHLAAELEAGAVAVNTSAVVGIDTPFGGFKQSGIGREFGIEGLEPYLRTKSVVMDLA